MARIGSVSHNLAIAAGIHQRQVLCCKITMYVLSLGRASCEHLRSDDGVRTGRVTSGSIFHKWEAQRWFSKYLDHLCVHQ